METKRAACDLVFLMAWSVFWTVWLHFQVKQGRLAEQSLEIILLYLLFWTSNSFLIFAKSVLAPDLVALVLVVTMFSRISLSLLPSFKIKFLVWWTKMQIIPWFEDRRLWEFVLVWKFAANRVLDWSMAFISWTFQDAFWKGWPASRSFQSALTVLSRLFDDFTINSWKLRKRFHPTPRRTVNTKPFVKVDGSWLTTAKDLLHGAPLLEQLDRGSGHVFSFYKWFSGISNSSPANTFSLSCKACCRQVALIGWRWCLEDLGWWKVWLNPSYI